MVTKTGLVATRGDQGAKVFRLDETGSARLRTSNSAGRPARTSEARRKRHLPLCLPRAWRGRRKRSMCAGRSCPARGGSSPTRHDRAHRVLAVPLALCRDLDACEPAGGQSCLHPQRKRPWDRALQPFALSPGLLVESQGGFRVGRVSGVRLLQSGVDRKDVCELGRSRKDRGAGLLCAQPRAVRCGESVVPVAWLRPGPFFFPADHGRGKLVFESYQVFRMVGQVR